MKKLFYLPALFLFAHTQAFTQGNCISVAPAVCVGDCLPVTYTGTAPSSAIYAWTSTCGNFTNPNQQNPGNHCFLQMGLCTLQVIVLDPGQAPDTCYAFVEVNPLPEGTIEEDVAICSGECAELIIDFSAGTPPFVYQVDDGFNTDFFTSFGFTDTITVCPIFTTTYTLAAITSGGNCQGNGPFNSATVTVLPGVTASVTQNGNILCANPPNQSYQWWDCSFNQMQASAQCVTITQDTCLCVIVSNAACADTVCADYFVPCDITCEIVLNDSICVGDSVIFAYSGNASANATFDWFIDLPGFPSAHFFGNDTVIITYDQAGCYDVSLIVTDGLCATMCSDSVCVLTPTSEATLGPDILTCDSCTSIPVFLSGIPPWNITLSDITTQYIITGVTVSPYLFVVCPPRDSTTVFTLDEVTDGSGLCPATIIDDSISVTVLSGLTALVTQTGDVLCADSVNGSYAWYDCLFNSLIDTSQCLTMTQSGCFCLVVTNALCQDTLCAEYVLDTCELTCNISLPDSACLGDQVVFAYTGNASSNAVFNWAIDLPGFPGTPFSGNDTVVLIYLQPGCYQATVTVFDAGCIVTCSDSVCIVVPKSEVSICCDEEKCDTCTTIEFTFTGAAPWTVYLTDGTTVDTIENITSSPYLHTVCPTSDSSITYTIVQVTDSCNVCPAVIVGDTSVTITLHNYPTASIIQTGNTLCANPPNMAGYGWYNCPAGGYLSIAQCFVPTISGCYCVDVSTAFDCVDTACFNFIISATTPIEDNLLTIYPVPSKGIWDISFSNSIILPVQWILYDVWGRPFESGIIEQSTTTLTLTNVPPTGLYYMKFISSQNQTSVTKVIIQ